MATSFTHNFQFNRKIRRDGIETRVVGEFKANDGVTGNCIVGDPHGAVAEDPSTALA
jgi:hypothetical protein